MYVIKASCEQNFRNFDRPVCLLSDYEVVSYFAIFGHFSRNFDGKSDEFFYARVNKIITSHKMGCQLSQLFYVMFCNNVMVQKSKNEQPYADGKKYIELRNLLYELC